MTTPIRQPPPRAREDPLDLSALAAVQHGCFTRAQATAAGVSNFQLRDRCLRGELHEPHPGVFTVTSTGPSFVRDCSAAVLSLPAGAIADRAAARLHSLEGFMAAPVALLVPSGGPTRRSGIELYRTTRWLPDQIERVRGLPVLSVGWTLARLGRVLDERMLERALDDALRKGVSEKDVRDVLDRLGRPGQRATNRLRRVLDQPRRMGPLTDSWFERLVDDALAAPGLPEPARQHQVVVRGRVIARLDLAYPVVRVGVEAQSRAHHLSPSARQADRRRISRLADAGWEIVEWCWEDLADSAEAVALVRNACHRQAVRFGIDPYHWTPVQGIAS